MTSRRPLAAFAAFARLAGSGVLAVAVVVLAIAAARPARAADCTGTSIGQLPLDELGAGTYMGYEGGLYPGGESVRPAAHDAALAAMGCVRPLDAAGVHDPVAGRIVLLSIGMSNTTQEFSEFIVQAGAEPSINPQLVLVDGAQGGQTAAAIRNPAANFWTVVDRRLAAAGVTGAQVQAIWLKEANAGPTTGFPAATQTLRDDLRAVVQLLKARFPNVVATFLSSRIYAGYADTLLNPEPYAFESGLAVKWLVEEQLRGDPALEFDPARGAALAPWLAWGPYLWADGLTPRASDGLTWLCSDFAADGTHPGPAGRAKVADMLVAFFESDPAARTWFLDCGAAGLAGGGVPAEVTGVTIARAAADVVVGWDALPQCPGPGAVHDVIGGSLSDLARERGFDSAACLASAGTGGAWTVAASALPAEAWLLVRGRNACAAGTSGDSAGGASDPRDALDAMFPGCP